MRHASVALERTRSVVLTKKRVKTIIPMAKYLGVGIDSKMRFGE